jgi:competence protein ComEA
LADGVRVHIPALSDPVTSPAAGVSGAEPGPGTPAGPVDLNTADAAALDALPGIGPVLAARIVADRDANGPFTTVADLDRVPGVGPATVAELDGLVTA